MKRLFVFFMALASSPVYSGIYRHDIDPEKYKKMAQQQEFACVGEVFEDHNGAPMGSCVLIGNRYVLSAAHCFIKGDNVIDTQYVIDGQKITIYKQINIAPGEASDYTFRFNHKRYAGKRLVIHPEYLANTREGKCDIVLIELEDTVDGIHPAAINSVFDELNVLATGVGYGVSGRADKPEEVDIYMEKIAGQNRIDSIGGHVISNRATVLMADFDHPEIKEWNKMGSPEPVELEYAVGGGDSGGPLFRQTKQRWELIGICSGGGVSMEDFVTKGYYSQVSQWTRVSVFYDWIENTIRDMQKNAE